MDVNGVSLSLPWIYTAALAAVTIAGKAGDALGPRLLGSQPILLLALNANDLHLALTSTTVPLVPWIVVGMTRRLVEDPVSHSRLPCRIATGIGLKL